MHSSACAPQQPAVSLQNSCGGVGQQPLPGSPQVIIPGETQGPHFVRCDKAKTGRSAAAPAGVLFHE